MRIGNKQKVFNINLIKKAQKPEKPQPAVTVTVPNTQKQGVPAQEKIKEATK